MENLTFRKLFQSIMDRRWFISALVLITFFVITLGILISIHTHSEVQGEWKELLLFLLGALIGSYGKIIDYWFDKERDAILTQKMDEEDGTVLSNVIEPQENE